MIELTDVLLKALDESNGRPLQLVDARTNVPYLLVRADLFERIQYAEDNWDGVDVGALIAEAMREDHENDPLLESYQKYLKAASEIV
jgi:hypothetical protein